MLQILEEQDAALVEANNTYEATVKENHDSTLKVTELSAKEAEAKAKRNALFREKIVLEKEVDLPYCSRSSVHYCC